MNEFQFFKGSDPDIHTHVATVVAGDDIEARSTLIAHIRGFSQTEATDSQPARPFVKWIEPHIERRHGDEVHIWAATGPH